MDSLSGLYQLLDSRVGTFNKLCRLQGKLDLMLAQQTALVSDGTPRDLATAINTPLMTVTAGGKKIFTFLQGGWGGGRGACSTTHTHSHSNCSLSTLDDNQNC